MLRPLRIVPDVATPMRDGVVLRADLYRPDDDAAYPVILARTPYGKQLADPARPWLRFAAAGYVVVVQDCRGCFASEGRFTPFADEGRDGYDTVEWLAAQPWCTGRVGMAGTSYLGATQWLAALERPPHLTTIVPAMTAADYHDGWIYQSGALLLSFALGWTLPFALREIDRLDLPEEARAARRERVGALLADLPATRAIRPLTAVADLLDDAGVAPYYRAWLEHPHDGDYWARWSIAAHHQRLDLPVLGVSGWYDMFLGGTLRNHTGMRARVASPKARGHQRLVVGPWAHGKPLFGGNPDPDFDFGPAAAGATIDVDGRSLRWYERWLKDDEQAIAEDPEVLVFRLGDHTWQELDAWPPPDAVETAYHLRAGGRLDREPPNDDEVPDCFTYDPLEPVPTRGGGAFLHDGARDQRRVEERADVLVYTSAPFAEPTEITGEASVSLWVRTSAVATDVTAKLVLVHEDGRAMNLADNVTRCLEPRPPGPLRVNVDLYGLSVLVAAGQRLRLEVSSSNHPRFDAHPNTGGPVATATATISAEQRVLHDHDHPSAVLLPVRPVRPAREVQD